MNGLACNYNGMNLKISVIIPCYQVEEYVAYVYADLCKQSFTDMEMIFVNDGGGENSVEAHS